MKFIEMTGKTLSEVITEGELGGQDLKAIGVHEHTVVRVNTHGDIEVRRPDRWDLVGGLLGGFEERIRKVTGMDWV